MPPVTIADPIAFAPLLLDAEARLIAAGIDDARLDLLYLAEAAFNVPVAQLRRRGEVVVPATGLPAFQEKVARRLTREPVQRILGRWEFWGLDLALGPETLIPRPDTETVVEAVLKRRPDRRTPWRVLDLGTGTGAILLALLSEYPEATGVGVDLSPEAAAVARGNAQALGLGERAGFIAGDWASALEGRFDIVVSNPPYIPEAEVDGLQPEVALFEPRRALAGGADGLDPYRLLAGEMARLLVPGGLVVMEHGADQGPAVAGLLREAGLADVATLPDLGGRDRVALGTIPITPRDL